MDVAKLKSQIQSKKLDGFYIFTGTEWYVQNLYMNQMAKAIDGELNFVDDVTDLFSRITKRGFINKNHVYVLYEDAEVYKNPTLIDKLQNIIRSDIVIYVLSSVDKRTKFYKTYKDTFIEFNALERAVLKRHVMNNIELTSEQSDYLIDICDSNYGRILLEIDKIKAYVDSDDSGPFVSDSLAFEDLLEEGTIYQPPYDDIFNFVDEVLKRNVSGVYDRLDNCKRIGESNLALLSVLYTNTKQVLQVQSYDGNNIEKATGLTAYQVRQIKKKCGKYRVGELVYMLKLIYEITNNIKLGKIDESIAVDYLLVNVL